MKKFDSFEELVSWQKSREFNKKIYLTTGSPDFMKDIDFIRQLRRASISISSNIAEGVERKSDKEFAYFLSIAKGSAGEVRSQLYLAYDLKYISPEFVFWIIIRHYRNIKINNWANQVFAGP